MIALIVILMKNARNAVEGKDDIADGVRKAHTNQPGASRNLIADGNTMNVRANTVKMGRKDVQGSLTLQKCRRLPATCNAGSGSVWHEVE